MYSLTTCGYCKQKVTELKQQYIAFTEYFIDEDSMIRAELFTKLAKSGYPSGSIGTPTFDVHGSMLPNNPDMSIITSVLLSTEVNWTEVNLPQLNQSETKLNNVNLAINC
tara:strand:- start:52600 stop:52929 length:330 start_codon:yes stop_codon:yes gene_type:complete